MSLQTVSCVVLICDGGCKDPWDEGIPHFTDEADALDGAKNYGWTVVAGDPVRTLCPSCAAKQKCQQAGHVWMDWTDLEHEGVRWRSRHCEVCDESQTDPDRDDLYLLFEVAWIINRPQTTT